MFAHPLREKNLFYKSSEFQKKRPRLTQLFILYHLPLLNKKTYSLIVDNSKSVDFNSAIYSHSFLFKLSISFELIIHFFHFTHCSKKTIYFLTVDSSKTVDLILAIYSLFKFAPLRIANKSNTLELPTQAINYLYSY